MILIPFIFVALAGLARAAHTARKDYELETEFLTWFSEWEGFMDWYVGGNSRYNPANIFTADFWHFCVFLQIYCWVGAVITASLWPAPWWIYLLVGSPVEGWSFVWFYHYVFPIEKSGSFRDFLKGSLTPWKNKHTRPRA